MDCWVEGLESVDALSVVVDVDDPKAARDLFEEEEGASLESTMIWDGCGIEG